MNALTEIQNKLKCAKSQYNTFGEYHYRSCEDILEAVKPLLGECKLYLTDELVEVGGKIYIKAIAHFYDENSHTKAEAYAREPDTRKKMTSEQITGSASSYARKYALNGLFLIDDTKEIDETTCADGLPDEMKADIDGLASIEALENYYKAHINSVDPKSRDEFIQACAKQKNIINNG